uniref:Uncharacterized protein n=1 Tax=Glossina palpalis gambiensis TaxID=67801 RepID=A0A1B0BIY4_9MUSC
MNENIRKEIPAVLILPAVSVLQLVAMTVANLLLVSLWPSPKDAGIIDASHTNLPCYKLNSAICKDDAYEFLLEPLLLTYSFVFILPLTSYINGIAANANPLRSTFDKSVFRFHYYYRHQHRECFMSLFVVI